METVYEIRKIMELLPHRYPFVLVDRIVEIVPDERIIGLKNVTINEPFFQGHFPGTPIMPGVLIIEAMAQVGAILVNASRSEERRKELIYFMGIDKARFRKPVVPGDQLSSRISIEVTDCHTGGNRRWQVVHTSLAPTIRTAIVNGRVGLKADAVVAADYSATLRTFPSIFFLLKKLLDAVLLDKVKVFDHAHPKESSIAFINMAKLFAWKIFTFIAVFHLAFQEQVASLLEKGTLLISWPATSAIRHSDTFTLYIMFEGKIPAAYPAVHSTRSD